MRHHCAPRNDGVWLKAMMSWVVRFVEITGMAGLRRRNDGRVSLNKHLFA
ncbi:MAG: hypothetical protein HON55_03210 [Legionellales bacterium]|nr:hypothetical protein [Legionellales bacterium]